MTKLEEHLNEWSKHEASKKKSSYALVIGNIQPRNIRSNFCVRNRCWFCCVFTR